MASASGQAEYTGNPPALRLRDRANVVCTACHARKVKCDLQSRSDSICANCRRLNQTCIRRDGLRKRRKTTNVDQFGASSNTIDGEEPFAAPDIGISAGDASSLHATSIVDTDLSRAQLRETSNDYASAHSTVRAPTGYISSSMVMAYEPAVSEAPASPLPLDAKTAILQLTQAHVLPQSPLLEALKDSFSQHMWSSYAIVNRDDVYQAKSSILLQQVICLAGSLMRRDPSTVEFARVQYSKIKTLIYLNYETDNMALLKTLCLLTCYSPLPSNQITLDGPWHWIGVAIRLAYQMGLHRHSTYDREADPGCRRRIFWYLVNSDRMAACCWGRPLTLQPQDHDVPNLSESDFAHGDIVSRVFLQTIRLLETTGAIANINEGNMQLTRESAAMITNRLCDWIRDLPNEFRLFDSAGTRNAFNRPVCALHINYFVNIILLQMLDSRGARSSIAASSLIAASCAARLYEEIHCREETSRLLHIHGFFCMVVAVPLICYPRQSVQDGLLRNEQLQLICTMLNEMRHRYGGWNLVLQKIKRLREDMAQRGDESLCEPTNIASGNPMWATSSLQTRQDELFPLPVRFRSHPAFPELDKAQFPRQPLADEGTFQDGSFPYVLDDTTFSIFDVLNLDFSFPSDVPQGL